MRQPINKLTIEGFKSIRKLEDLRLGSINVLIGANGSGKSNFVSCFSFLADMFEKRLQYAVAKHGGAEAHLYLGSKATDRIVGRTYFGKWGHAFALEPTADERLVFDEETLYYDGEAFRSSSRGHLESVFVEPHEYREAKNISENLYSVISSWVVYHFHDTSDTAKVKRRGAINDNERLRNDAGNLAAFLLRLRNQHKASYRKIRDAVRLIAPFFDDFKLRPIPANEDNIQLEWMQKSSDYPFLAGQLSDGTLRFICLATALLQPEPPSTILIDEPELGLHPYALALFAGLVGGAGERMQIILSTQSAALLDHFDAGDVIIVERKDGESIFNRLSREDLHDWLREYSLGELWEKNVLGGRPNRCPA